MTKAKILEPHARSLEATADADTLDLIMSKRLEADEDLRQMETWYRNGCTSGQSLDNPEA